MFCFATCLIPKADLSFLPLGKNLGAAVGALYHGAVALSTLSAYLPSLIFLSFQLLILSEGLCLPESCTRTVW